MFSTLAFAEGSSNSTESSSNQEVQSNEEMIVHSQTMVAKKKRELENKLRRIGYKKFIRKNGKTVVRHALPYRPTVVLDDDGWINLKRSPIRFEPPGKAAERSSKLRYLWCLPPLTVMCVRIGGQMVSRRRLVNYKSRVATRSRSYVKNWQEAIISNAMDNRLNNDIPNMLEAIWEHGLTDGEDSPYLETAKERREVILRFWSTRTCIKEGAQARKVVHDFIVHEIQASEHPADKTEINAANAAQGCLNTPLLPLPGDP